MCVGRFGAELEDMFTLRRIGHSQVAAASLLAAGAASFLIGSLLAGATSAAPSSFIELDGDVRSDGALDWARSGGSSGTDGAFDGGAFVNASTPPTPPVATAALTGSPGFLSAAFVVDPLDVDANPCAPGNGTANGDPTTFTGAGGEKNGDRIDTMTFGTGSVPNKDDLSNVYAISHATGLGGAEVFFGSERVVNNGDSHVDFEFLHAGITRAAGCSGGFAGDRSQGDLLVAVDFTQGGTLGGTSIYQWHCADEADPQPADGTVCNPAATGPTVPHYQDVTAVPAIAAAVTVKVNDLAAADCGGWACRAADGTQVASLATDQLVEGGVDLTATGFTGCAATLFPHTRTSQQFTATLKDFTGPVPLDLCATPQVATTSSPTGGDVPTGTPATDTATVTSGGAPVTTGTVAFFLCQPEQTDATGCPAPAGTQIGTVQALDAGGQASPSVAAVVTTSVGTYCWRAEYTPAAGNGLHPTTHTNRESECFTTVAQVTTTTTTTTLPETTTTTAPATTTTLGTTTTTIAAQVLGVVLTAPAVSAGELPRTGSTIRPLLIWGGLAMMIGGLLVLGARPRRESS